jgi:3,4-dihydroxy-2-butanone 4-phosphate synthase/GTP cyclohydrolase II
MNRAAQSAIVRRVACTRLPTKWGMFQAIGYEREIRNGVRRLETAVALVLGDATRKAPLLRIHSQCLTGDALASQRCDCGDQLELAMHAIAHEGCGLLIYEHQEGRGIGLMAKLQAYALQDTGLDTIEANQALGYRADCRDFALAVAILQDLGVSHVRLLSNNPRKFEVLREAGIDIVDRVSCEVPPNPHSLAYLRVKKAKMGHVLTLEEESVERVGEKPSDWPGECGWEREAAYQQDLGFASIDAAICEIRAGRMIVVVDDEDRENEGDLTMAAEMITPEAITFMATHARGLVCLAMTGDRLDELELVPMVQQNTALGGTAFTVSIDALGHGVTTGISSHDRAQTIRAATDPRSGPEDFARPGHVFPLRCRPGGVLERRGQTEAAVDLARLAGLRPSGVICEILNDDGTMARVPDLIRFCRSHDLKMITVGDLARYRFERECDVFLGAMEGLFATCG